MRLLKNYGNIFRMCAYLFHISPDKVIWTFVLGVLRGLVAPATTILMARAAEFYSSGKMIVSNVFLICIIAIAITSVIDDVFNNLSDYITKQLGFIAEPKVKKEFLARVTSLDLREREMCDFGNQFEFVFHSFNPEQLGSTLRQAAELCSALISVVASMFLLMRVNLSIGIAMLILVSISACLTVFSGKKEMESQNRDMKSVRKERQVYENCINKNNAAELRVAHKTGWLIDRWAQTFENISELVMRRSITAQGYGVAANLLISIGQLVLIAVYVLQSAGKSVSGANIVIIINSLMSASSILNRLVTKVGSINLTGEHLGYYFRFFESNFHLTRKEGENRSPVKIILRDVTFSYNGEDNAVENISIDIKAGERIALVGENGSGKTTLAKMLLGIYNPTAGFIEYYDNEKKIDTSYVSAVMQNFAKYEIRICENIGLGQYHQMENDKALHEAYEYACGESLFAPLDEALGAQYGSNTLIQGRELSGGQWQRLAIARALLRQAPLYVMDEPNAALDPFAEAAMIKRMFEKGNGKTCVFITHRLTTTALADRIIVLKDGAICEQGTHEELMKQNDEYARMYNTQAVMYK